MEQQNKPDRPFLPKYKIRKKSAKLSDISLKLFTLLTSVIRTDTIYFFSNTKNISEKAKDIEGLLDKMQDIVDYMRKLIIKSKIEESRWAGLAIEFSTRTGHVEIESEDEDDD